VSAESTSFPHREKQVVPIRLIADGRTMEVSDDQDRPEGMQSRTGRKSDSLKRTAPAEALITKK
jgi:hypothetical protein